MRLIDAEKLMEYLGLENTQAENYGEIITLTDIDNQPTAYDIEAVVRQLKAERMYKAVEIVKGAVK